MVTKTQHICKFKRLKYKTGNTIFFCSLPDCNKKLNTALALGKRSICWRCGEPFIMNEYSLRLAKPHCENCHKPKNVNIKMDEIIQTDKLPLYEELSLIDRLQQTIKQAQPEEEDI